MNPMSHGGGSSLVLPLSWEWLLTMTKSACLAALRITVEDPLLVLGVHRLDQFRFRSLNEGRTPKSERLLR